MGGGQRRGGVHDDDTYMTPQDRPDFVAFGLKMTITGTVSCIQLAVVSFLVSSLMKQISLQI